MTITIADGRGALWQWDTGRKVKITDGDGVKQIHYQNRCFGRSVDVGVGADGTAIIPDELLQDWHTLTAYAYVTDDTGAYTMVQQDFVVHKRGKPADYVYTPTGQMTLQMIQRQIGDLADLTTEAKDTLVAAINEAARTGGGAGSMELRVADGYVQYSTDGGSTWTNLIAVAELKGADGKPGASGAPGKDGAKGDPGEPGKDGHSPVVTATKSGKTTTISVDGETIATVEDGADGTPGKDGVGMDITGATVGQIAKISAVDESGVPTAWSPADMPSGGGGSAETFELIKYIKIAEAVNEIRINADDSGEPFELKEARIYTQLYLQDDVAARIGIRLHSSINGDTTHYNWPFIASSANIKSNKAASYPAGYAGYFKPKDYTISNKRYWVADTWSAATLGTPSVAGAVSRLDFLNDGAYETHVMDAVRCVMISANNGAVQIDANSEIWIFGKRGTVT